MLQPISKVEELDGSNNYFYDHLHNQIYYLKDGQIYKKNLTANDPSAKVSIGIHKIHNEKKIFPKLEIVKGTCRLNLQKTSVTNQANEPCVVKSDVQVVNGSVWEWYVPSSLNQVKLGFVQITKHNNFFEEYYNLASSTSRIVKFAFVEDQIRVWVNDQKPKKQHSKKLNLDPERQSRFYPVVSCSSKGQTAIFNPFCNILGQKHNYNSIRIPQSLNLENSSKDWKIQKITQLSQNKCLLIARNSDNVFAKVITRNCQNKKFEFPTIQFSNQSHIHGLFCQKEIVQILRKDGKIGSLWNNISADNINLLQVYPLIQKSIAELQQANAENSAPAFRILIEKILILRSLSSEFSLRNPIYQSGLDRSLYSQTSSHQTFSSLPHTVSSRISSSRILNSERWTKIEGTIQGITQNYILSADGENVLIYNINKRITEVFKENIVFFEFNKNAFHERFNENELRLLKKGEASSSIYKLLTSCFSKEKKKITEVFEIKESDLKELVHDFKISEADAKLSLEQTGSVEEALVWLSQNQQDRQYVEKHDESKNKNGEQQKIKGSLIEFKDQNLVKLALLINKNVYLLGYDPKVVSKFLTKADKQYINLYDCKRQFDLESIDTSSWYFFEHHQKIEILDSLALKQQAEFLFKQNGKLYICQNENDVLMKTQALFNSSNIFQNDTNLTLGSQEPFETFVDINTITRNINGEIFYEGKLSNLNSIEGVLVVGQHIYSNWSSNVEQILEIQATIDEKQFNISYNQSKSDNPFFIPVLIESGPVGVNAHYEINSILYPSGSFLANYAQSIRLKNIHSKHMRVTNFLIEKPGEGKNVNSISSGIVYFESENGVQSKHYQFSFAESQKSKNLQINQNGFWKYIIVKPTYQKEKKLPFEYGYIGVKGFTIQNQIYQNLLIQEVEKSLEILCHQNVQIQKVRETSNKIVKISVKIDQNNNKASNSQISTKNILKSVLNTYIISRLKKIQSKQEQQQQQLTKKIETLSSKEFNQLYLKSKNQGNLLKKIIKNNKFSFAHWQKTDIRKFMDMVFVKADNLKEEAFKTLFDKILQSQQAKKYFNEQCADLGKCYIIFPQNYLPYMIKKVEPIQHRQNLKDLLKLLSKQRSEEYKQVRKRNIPYLILQTNFYSTYYLDQIQKLRGNYVSSGSSQIFEELELALAQIAVIKDEVSRKIFIKLDGTYLIKQIILRFDRTQISSKISFKLYAYDNSGRKFILKDNISQAQWNQVCRYFHDQKIKELYSSSGSAVNSYPINLNNDLTANYLEIQILYHQTGIAINQSQSKAFPFIDIIPEVFGQKVTTLESNPKNTASISKYFTFSPEDSFYLSTVDIGSKSLEKHSISKQSQYQYTYIKPAEQNILTLKQNIQQKINNQDYSGIINDHKKLVKNLKSQKQQPKRKLSLDYIYTVLMLTFEQIFTHKIKIAEDECKELFELIIKEQIGPIRLSAFKAASNSVSYLIKSLPYIEEQGYLPNLEQTNFDQKQIEEILDLQNIPLCNSLNKLIINSIPYKNEWATFLIKLSPVTQKYEQIIKYILKSSSWYKSSEILKFVSEIPENIFTNVLLANIDSQSLEKFILELKKSNLTSRIYLLADKLIQSQSKKIDLDIVSMMIEESEIRWHNLYKIIKKCPEAQDLILNQYLMVGQQKPSKLAKNYPEILNQAALSNKHSENLAAFLNKLFAQNRQVFKKTIINLEENSGQLHADMFEVFTYYLYEQCNFGGVQGSKILQQEELLNLHVAQILLKKLNQSSFEEVSTKDTLDEILIQWYFCNNNYEYNNISPANKSPGMYLIKVLSENVLLLIKNRSIDKILKVFDRLIKEIHIEHIPLSTKHIYINQINQGVSQLLGKSIDPESLTNVLISGNNQMLQRIFQSLEKNKSKNAGEDQSNWKNCKQIDFTTKFTSQTNIKDKIKDWEANRSGSKNVLFKIPITTNKIFLKNTQSQGSILSKIIIGFNVTDNNEKNNIFPGSVQLYGGQDQKSLVKICDLKQIQDQNFYNFGVKIYGVNFNSITHRKLSRSVNALEFRLTQPFLTSVSDTLEDSQKSKKQACYSVSFLTLMGYQTQPETQPSYNQIYMTLLSFLSDQKYNNTLKAVVESTYYSKNSKSILKLLNSLLPNAQIEKLLLSLNRQNQDVLVSILQNKSPNIKLIQLLMQSKTTSENIKKLLDYFLSSRNSQKITDIIISSIKLFSYANPNVKINFEVKKLIDLYQKSGTNKSIFKVLATILSTSSNFNFDYKTVVEELWTQTGSERSLNLQLIGATIGYYSQILKYFLASGKTEQLAQQTSQIMTERTSNVRGHIYLLSQLSLHHQNRQYLINNNYPIKIVQLLRTEDTLLNKNYTNSIKYFILLFQSTCINSKCEERFSEILIELMVKLPEINATHHNFFIHEFFFPLINAFKGVPIKFIWKTSRGYLYQATHALKHLPIKSNNQVIVVNGNYLEKTDLKWSKINDKQNYQILNKNNEVVNEKITNEALDAQNSEYQIYKIATQDYKSLLTNQTLIKIKNLNIFGNNYSNQLPAQDSTFERIYYLPSEMTLNDVLKQINICGYRLNEKSISDIKIFISKENSIVEAAKEQPLEKLIPQQNIHFITLEINAESLFANTSIEQIAKNSIQPHVFIPQQTVFKAFEKKQGLMKMITVLKTCVKNWSNADQSKIWEQYLNELQSYSCFPVFSSIYMNKQQNVQLLFNILSGLPDKEDSKKWVELEKVSVKFLYDIIKDVFEVEGSAALEVRKFAIENGFYKTMLERLHLVTKEPKRYVVDEIQQEQQLQIPTHVQKVNSQDQYKLKVVKKKGIGYGNDSSSNQKWDIIGQEQKGKQLSSQVLGLLKILQKFIDHKSFEPPKEIVQQTFESALLPILQASLRGGSLLEISKFAQLFKGQLDFIKAITKKKSLIPILISIPKIYEPKQHQSIFELLKVLESTSRIFLSCLTGSVSEKLSEEMAKGIIQTYQLVDQAVSNYNLDNIDEDEDKKILELALGKKYTILLKDLRFDYVDMKDKGGKISKHHYASNFIANHKSPPAKTIRLAQQLADISHALPVEHTNAIYVRCDKERVDFMQALIMGSNGTPYGHGAYLFDIYFDDTYPNNPPKVNLTTTGSGQIRFNPNLYSCGKVCLSLLGTWRGSAMENWDPKVSTLLQILVSIQSIIMSEQVYFNEPGFQHEQGTVEGQKKNEAYANIVRYGNVKFAMLQNIKNPPKGFEHIIRRHFYLKKDEILEQTKKWLKYAQKREASYQGLVSDHNNNWCNTFRKSKTEYKTMLQKAIKQLEVQLEKLPQPSNKDLKTLSSSPKKQKKAKKVKIEDRDENIEQVDVTYDKTETNNLKELDINDEKVKDRWSRYIGAMGLEAVSKQAKANILLIGLGATGVEIAKNIILSGCRKISIADDKEVEITDLAGQFFLTEQDLGKKRVQSCLYKLKQLNHYVRVQQLKFEQPNLDVLKQYDVVILTEQSLARQKLVNAYCHENKIKFIITDCYGPFGQHFNDFGTDFEVLDKNGEETVEVMIENITSAQKGVVTLLNKQRHPYEDGQVVRISGVKGMKKQNGDQINGTIHKIRVINQFSFEIGDTSGYSAYEIDGVARNMKLPLKVQFKSLAQSLPICNIDSNLAFYDFEKSTVNEILHKCFITLSNYRQKYNKFPQPWNWEDGQTFLTIFKEIHTEEFKQPTTNFIRTFAYTCSGTFAPLAAFYGGLTAQQVFKAITGKYMPINQYFFTEFTEVVPTLPEVDEQIQNLLKQVNYEQSKEHRNEGLRRVVGNELNKLIENCRVFLIGSGAIGCELLKNYAMINLGVSGEIVVTDPDHIEESNLNRQFLFRQKHLRKPKSVTAAAAVSQMNKLLKGKIRAKLDRVCQSTKDVFSNEFFESLSIVTNALDNVKARQYVDQRCVESKVALLQSGTLSSKGHVQVIIPYLTQTYGSKNDPAEDGQIPHCTLKMFPEQTLHCVQWARDIFGKTFTLDPKALGKLVEKWKDYNPTSADLDMLKNCQKLIQTKPKNFEEAILIATNKFFELYRNDIKQLLYTYPLDAQTKDGKPFWKLPKRPPTPIEQIDPSNQLHSTFISSYAVLLCKIFNMEHPKDFRKAQRRQEICKQAAKIKIPPFVPNDKLAKQMAQQVDKSEQQSDPNKIQSEQQVTQISQGEIIIDENSIFSNIRKAIQQIEQVDKQLKVSAQQFEKDDDQNGHIDLIYSMANLRASNYKLQPMDWMTTKLKAGRITPALSTTTSCVAALQTIELIKYIKKCKLGKMRNTFINLAVPMIQAGQPGDVEKIKIHNQLTTNIWERWDIGPLGLNQLTLGQFLKQIQEKYKITVKILSILQGGQVYSDLVLGLESKKQQKEEHLKKLLKDILSSEIEGQIKKFVDFTLVFSVNDQLAKHVPTLRLLVA